MYKKVADAQYRSKLSNELMMYHMKVSTNFYIDLELDTNDPTHQHPDQDSTEVICVVTPTVGLWEPHD